MSVTRSAAQLVKAARTMRWVPAWLWQRITRRPPPSAHLLIMIADHFEPEHEPGSPARYASLPERQRRVEDWCRAYPLLVDRWRDADDQPLRRTYFYPAEHYQAQLIERLAEHCRDGWGELEVHLHHGVEAPDTADRTRETLVQFRDALAKHGCLSRLDDQGPLRYAFVHGNWALANSAGGRFCGVDEEMRILAETGCYADFTLPCAPAAAQIRKINAVYECETPLDRRAPHRRGRDLRVGRRPEVFPLMIQGPLALGLREGRAPRPQLENSALTAANPPTLARLGRWRRAAISVDGRPEWIFIKLHCHSMSGADTAALLGEPTRRFLRALTDGTVRDRIHFVTGREMVNIMLAACDGRVGNPRDYRDYRLRLTHSRRPPLSPMAAQETSGSARGHE